MKCSHKTNSKCQLTVPLLGEAIDVTPDDCAACSSLEPYRAQKPNYVVATIALNAVRQRDPGLAKVMWRGLDGYFNVSVGVGDELEKIIRWTGVRPDPEACDCGTLKSLMNTMGPRWCRKNRPWLVRQLRKHHRALKIKLPFIRPVVASAIIVSCRRAMKITTARQAEQRHYAR
jgi:hypothetical protein